jgi:hypothetical protein
VSSDVIMFCFGGRRANMTLQLPFIDRILDEHPNVTYHLWNLARDPVDDRWIRGMKDRRERFVVVNDFRGPEPWSRFNDVYQHYAHPRYEGKLFVKLDDDVVWIESARFGDYLIAVDEYRDTLVSATVINNGACTRAIPELWSEYEKLQRKVSFPLLDVHKRPEYAELCHNFFADNYWKLITGRPSTLLSTSDWLSINFVGYDWPMASIIASRLGKPSPSHIAGRMFRPRATLGDEGLMNTLPRCIFEGMTVAHLYFGPQLTAAGEAPFTQYRNRYAEIGEEYLSCTSQLSSRSETAEPTQTGSVT